MAAPHVVPTRTPTPELHSPHVATVLATYWLWPDLGLLSLDRAICFRCTVCHRELQATLVAVRDGHDLACPGCFAELGRTRSARADS